MKKVLYLLSCMLLTATMSQATKITMIKASWCGPCKEALPKFQELGKEFPNVEFVVMDEAEPATREIIKKNKVGGFPTFLVENGGNVTRTIVGGNMRAIREEAEKGGAAPKDKSKKEQEKPAKKEKVKKDKSKKTAPVASHISGQGCEIVMVKANWCGFCKKAEPEFRKLAGNYPQCNFVVLDEADKETRKVIDKHGVKGFPTILVHHDGKVTRTIVGGDMAAVKEEAEKASSGKEMGKDVAPQAMPKKVVKSKKRRAQA